MQDEFIDTHLGKIRSIAVHSWSDTQKSIHPQAKCHLKMIAIAAALVAGIQRVYAIDLVV